MPQSLTRHPVKKYNKGLVVSEDMLCSHSCFILILNLINYIIFYETS